MPYYNYHGKIQQRIKQGELVGFEYVDEYNGISPCLVLEFCTEPKLRPVRSHRFEEYERILNEKP